MILPIPRARQASKLSPTRKSVVIWIMTWWILPRCTSKGESTLASSTYLRLHRIIFWFLWMVLMTDQHSVHDCSIARYVCGTAFTSCKHPIESIWDLQPKQLTSGCLYTLICRAPPDGVLPLSKQLGATLSLIAVLDTDIAYKGDQVLHTPCIFVQRQRDRSITKTNAADECMRSD